MGEPSMTAKKIRHELSEEKQAVDPSVQGEPSKKKTKVDPSRLKKAYDEAVKRLSLPSDYDTAYKEVKEQYSQEDPFGWVLPDTEKDKIASMKVKLDPQSPFYKRVEVLFKTSVLNDYDIVQMTALVNLEQWKMHWAFVQKVLKRFDGKTDRYYKAQILAWHGCPRDAAEKIKEEGFRRDVSKRKGWYGPGTYCAKEARYSIRAGYAKIDTEGLQRIFLCIFMVGSFRNGSFNQDIAPLADDDLPADTKVNSVVDPTTWVSGENEQVVPIVEVVARRRLVGEPCRS